MITALDLVRERDKCIKEYENNDEYIIGNPYNLEKEEIEELRYKNYKLERRGYKIERTLQNIMIGEKNKNLERFKKLEPEEIRDEINKETGCSIAKVKKLVSADLEDLVGLELYDMCYSPRELKAISDYFKNCKFGIFTPNEKDSDVGDMVYLNINIWNWEE